MAGMCIQFVDHGQLVGVCVTGVHRTGCENESSLGSLHFKRWSSIVSLWQVQVFFFLLDGSWFQDCFAFVAICRV